MPRKQKDGDQAKASRTKKSDNSKERKGEDDVTKPKKTKKAKKSIYVSYSPDAPFAELKFAIGLVQQLKENNLSDDIWFDKDEVDLDNPMWFTQRLETFDKCKVAVLLVSKSYMSCPISASESQIITERYTNGSSTAPKVFCVILEPVEFTKSLADSLLLSGAELIDITGELLHLSIDERISFAFGSLYERLEKLAVIKSRYIVPSSYKNQVAYDAWQKKRVIHWSSGDVVEWLYSIKIREFYRQAFAEKQIDGVLLLSSNDYDLHNYIGVESQIVRKKIFSELRRIVSREIDHPDHWFLHCRSSKQTPNSVYIVYDPQDSRLASNVKSDLQRRGLQVKFHEKLGQSRQEFLQINGGTLARCSQIVCLVTEAAGASPFVYNEVLFASWIHKGASITCLLFANSWAKMKNPLKGILGDSQAIDFEGKLYSDSMDILEYHLKPNPNVTGVVFEQSFLEHMRENICTLRNLCKRATQLEPHTPDTGLELYDLVPKVYISYQWDVQDKVRKIATYLENQGLPCWQDINMISTTPTTGRSTSSADVARIDTLEGCLYHNMKLCGAVVCCLTPKYINSTNCEQDLLLAQSLRKPVVPILLHFVAWPPENARDRIRRTLVQFPRPVDLSNDKLFQANLPALLDRLVRLRI